MYSNTIHQMSLTDYVTDANWQLKETTNNSLEKITIHSTDTFLKFLKKAHEEIKRLNKRLEERQHFIEKYEVPYPFLEDLQKDFSIFIKWYFQIFHTMNLETVYDLYSDFPSEYHNLGKLFLNYLEIFVFNEDELTLLNDEDVLLIEKFIENDPVKYRNSYLSTLKKIKNREKLRAGNYIVVHIEPILKRLEKYGNDSLDQMEIDIETKKICSNPIMQSVIFEQGDELYIKEHEQEIMAIFFCYFLERNYKNSEFKNFIPKIENYIIHHFSFQLSLSKKHIKMVELVRKNVALRTKKYVEEEYKNLKESLNQYDQNLKNKKNGIVQILTTKEDVSSFPILYSENQIKEKMIVFLESIFMFTRNRESTILPIYEEDLKPQKFQAMEIALEYLERFGYSGKNTLAEDWIERLEDLLYEENDFQISSPILCATKSRLYARVANRRIIKREKKLQSI